MQNTHAWFVFKSVLKSIYELWVHLFKTVYRCEINTIIYDYNWYTV